MSYQDQGKVISLKAAATIPAYTVVYLSAANTVSNAVTDTSIPIGVSADYAETNGSVGVVISGIARCKVATSITAGEMVSFATDAAGFIRSLTTNTTITSALPVLGIALETASTSGNIIPVLLAPQFQIKR
jgi:hypothetical protein